MIYYSYKCINAFEPVTEYFGAELKICIIQNNLLIFCQHQPTKLCQKLSP